MLVFFSVLCIFPVINVPISCSGGECLYLHVGKEKFFVVSGSFSIVDHAWFSGSHHKLSSAVTGTNFKESYCDCSSIGAFWVTTVPCPPINSTALSRIFQRDVEDNSSQLFWHSFSCVFCCFFFFTAGNVQSSKVHDRSLL